MNDEINNNQEFVYNSKTSSKKALKICIFMFILIFIFIWGMLFGKILFGGKDSEKCDSSNYISSSKLVRVPIATKKLAPNHLITQEDIGYVKIPSDAFFGDYYVETENIIGKYVNYDTTIQEGSLFYHDAIITSDELPDEALLNVPDGESLYYLTVNMLSSYSNSIMPGSYIDIYISTKDNNKALVGKLIENVKILQVKTADGRNVFDDSDESKIPYVIIFSLPEEQHLLMRNINAINNYSISSSNSEFSKIEVIPVPTKVKYNDDDEVLSMVTSEFLKDYIMSMANVIPE